MPNVTVPGNAIPWDPSSNPYFYAGGGFGPIHIPCSPFQIPVVKYISGTITTPITGSLDPNGAGIQTTGGVFPWPSDRLPGGFLTGSVGECVGSYCDVTGIPIGNNVLRFDLGPITNYLQVNPPGAAPAGTTSMTIGVNFNGSFGGNGGFWNFYVSTIAAPVLWYAEPVRPFTLKAGLPGSKAGCLVPPTSNVSLPFVKNGSSVGSVNILAGGTTATFTFPADVSVNGLSDTLEIDYSLPSDPTFAKFWFKLQTNVC